MSYNTVVWLPNALILTFLLAAVAIWRWRSAGALSGLRWTGVAILPLALYAIGAYRLLWSVGLAVSRFVTGFVFRPSVWLGVVLLAVAVALIVLPPRLGSRMGSKPGSGQTSKKPVVSPASRASGDDDDMTEIEDILKRHGLG